MATNPTDRTQTMHTNHRPYLALAALTVASVWLADDALAQCAPPQPASDAYVARPADEPVQRIDLDDGAVDLLADHDDDVIGIAVDPSGTKVYARDRHNVIHISGADSGLPMGTIDTLTLIAAPASTGGLDWGCGWLIADVEPVGGGAPYAVRIDPQTGVTSYDRQLPLDRGERVGAMAYRNTDGALLVLVDALGHASVRTVDAAGSVVEEKPLPSDVQATALDLDVATGELVGVDAEGDELARHLDLDAGTFTRQAIAVPPHGAAGGLALATAAALPPGHEGEGEGEGEGEDEIIDIWRHPLPEPAEGEGEEEDEVGGREQTCERGSEPLADALIDYMDDQCGPETASAFDTLVTDPECPPVPEPPCPDEMSLEELEREMAYLADLIRNQRDDEQRQREARGTSDDSASTGLYRCIVNAETELHNLMVTYMRKLVQPEVDAWMAEYERRLAEGDQCLNLRERVRQAEFEGFGLLLANFIAPYAIGELLVGGAAAFFSFGVKDIAMGMATQAAGIDTPPTHWLDVFFLPAADEADWFSIERCINWVCGE